MKDTLQLRKMLIRSLEDVIEKRITPNDARARAMLARGILDTVRVEIQAARIGLSTYEPVAFIPHDKKD